MQLGHKTNLWPLSSAKVKNAWSFTSTPHTFLVVSSTSCRPPVGLTQPSIRWVRGLFLQGKCDRNVKLTINFLVPRLRMRGGRQLYEQLTWYVQYRQRITSILGKWELEVDLIGPGSCLVAGFGLQLTNFRTSRDRETGWMARRVCPTATTQII
jgi:hypothetical protein